MALKAVGLGKRFPGVVALNDVHMEVPAGQVMALVGANGAGKSTFIKILTGYYNHYEGDIHIDDVQVDIHRPSDAMRHGIQAVYQEVDTVLVPDLTVTENLLLNETVQDTSNVWMNWRSMNQRAREILEEMHLNIDVTARVEDLVLHQKQMLVIARAVHQQVKYLIFDEPTTSLSLPEVAELFTTIRRLQAEGIGIIYISHRLAEIRQIADDITILRNGEKVAHFPVSEYDVGRISEGMLGAAVTEAFPPKEDKTTDTVIMEVKALHHRGVLHDINFKVHQGEILGVAGLVGAGKTELMRALFGADPIDGGEITVDGKPIRMTSPNVAVENGIFLVPEERRSQGVLVEDPIQRNISLPFLSAFTWIAGLMRYGAEHTNATRIAGDVDLKPRDVSALVKNLSGGNQQKVAIGKWFGSAARVMIFDEATQGIDVRAKYDVYVLAQKLCEHAAVIYASSDIDEVIGVANRVIVMRDGRIIATLTEDEMDRQLILEYATGARGADGQLRDAPQPLATTNSAG